MMSTVVAYTHGTIYGMYLFIGDSFCCGPRFILSPFEGLNYEARDKSNTPKEHVNHPPPPTDAYPPKTAMTFLSYTFGLRFRLCSFTRSFLHELHIYVFTTAFRASHSPSPFIFRAAQSHLQVTEPAVLRSFCGTDLSVQFPAQSNENYHSLW